MRIDSDVLAWLKNQGKGYPTRINAILREAMSRQDPPPPSIAVRSTTGWIEG